MFGCKLIDYCKTTDKTGKGFLSQRGLFTILSCGCTKIRRIKKSAIRMKQ